jgi:hypothetical protein
MTQAVNRSFQAEFRPLVEAAWKNHAGLYGVSCQDTIEKDSWYRDNLWAACRVKTTRGINTRQEKALIAWFQKLGTETATRCSSASKISGWSGAQSDVFWKLARKAHGVARERDEDGADVDLDAWLERALQGQGKALVRDVHGTWLLGSAIAGFERAMADLAVIAGDEYWMGRTAGAVESRLRFQIDRFLFDLSWLEGRTCDWAYIVGIHDQAHGGLPADATDATAPQLYEILQILDTQIRRLCRQAKIAPCCLPTRPPVSPARFSEWQFYHSPTPGFTRRPDGTLFGQEGTHRPGR